MSLGAKMPNVDATLIEVDKLVVLPDGRYPIRNNRRVGGLAKSPIGGIPR
jgi:hypothetical protein